MKSTKRFEEIDDCGRVPIPKPVRKNFGLSAGSLVEILINGDFICLRPRKRKTSAKSDYESFRDFNIADKCDEVADYLFNLSRDLRHILKEQKVDAAIDCLDELSDILRER